MKVTLALLEENASGQFLKLRVYWTRKGCILQVSYLSKTSSSQTLVCIQDFFRVDKLLASALMAAARLAGSSSSELTCELIEPGGGDGGLDSGKFNNVWEDLSCSLSSYVDSGGGFLRRHDGR